MRCWRLTASATLTCARSRRFAPPSAARGWPTLPRRSTPWRSSTARASRTAPTWSGGWPPAASCSAPHRSAWVARATPGRWLPSRAPGAPVPQTPAALRTAGARTSAQARSAPQPDGAGGETRWLRKPRLGGGGRGVRPYRGGPLAAGEILQRYVAGLSCSAVAIADGRRALMLGVTEQLHLRPGFRWCGNVVPPRLPATELAELEGQLRAVCAQAAERFGLRGAFGVDAIWDGHRTWVLELNPRPTAALELFGRGTFHAHVLGARGRLAAPEGWPSQAASPTVKLVLYAS